MVESVLTLSWVSDPSTSQFQGTFLSKYIHIFSSPLKRYILLHLESKVDFLRMWDFSFLPASWHHSNTAATEVGGGSDTNEPSNETGAKVRGMRGHSFKTWGGMKQARVASGSSLLYSQFETITSTSRGSTHPASLLYARHSPLWTYRCYFTLCMPRNSKMKIPVQKCNDSSPSSKYAYTWCPSSWKRKSGRNGIDFFN